MRIGLNTFLYTSPFTTRSTRPFETFARQGFDLVETAIEEPAHIDAAEVKAAADAAGVAIGLRDAMGEAGRIDLDRPHPPLPFIGAGGDRRGEVRRTAGPGAGRSRSSADDFR